MKLSIIVVNYNTYTLTKQTIDSIVNYSYPFTYEIIVVDNGSQDGSAEQLEALCQGDTCYQEVHLIKNQENLGFAKANNRGIRLSRGEYILLLNSDTQVARGCLEGCLHQITLQQKIGALGCKVILPDGTLDHACKRGFPTPQAALYYFLKWDKKNPEKYGQYDALYLGEDEAGEVDVLTGAFMLMPRQVLDEVGLLDEAFFMYGEDIDLCYRIKAAGYTVFYEPSQQITHFKGGSSTKKRYKVIYDFHHAMWLFYKKHYAKEQAIGFNVLVRIGIIAKCLMAFTKNLLKTQTKGITQEKKESFFG